MASHDHDLHDAESLEPPRNRLPTLMEVLGRRTTAPVDLFSFYIYMRDQQRSVDYLDFWLDVSQHMSLCRHYVRELRRSVLVETPELEKSGSKRSSAVLDQFQDMNEPAGPSDGMNGEKTSQDQRLSAFLRSENGKPSHSPHSSSGSHLSHLSQRPSHERPPRPSFMSTPDPRTDSNSPGRQVARNDIRQSAEKILYTFLLPGSEREIILPDHMLRAIIEAIEQEGRDDPEVFDEGKDYVFQAMERDAFPGFLQAKAFGNLVPPSVFLRLIFGLASMAAGIWAAFVLVFRNYPRHTRCWLILPLTLGVYFLISYVYKLDPLLTWFGYSEYTFMNWSRIREPFVRKLLNKRALMAMLVSLIITVGVCVLFIFVPSTDL